MHAKMATPNYFTPQEALLRNLLHNGDLAQAEVLIRSDAGNIILEQPLRVVTQLALLKEEHGYYYTHEMIYMCKPLEQIDSFVVYEVKRRSSLNWRIILFIARLKAKAPRKRVIFFENANISQKLYNITCSTRQGLIEHIIDMNIFDYSYAEDALMCAYFSNRQHMFLDSILLTENIPKSWDHVVINFAPIIENSSPLQVDDPLTDALMSMSL